MRAKEFGSWASKDNSKGGFHNYGDGFNRELKGKPYQKYKEYAESDLDEYHKYPETKDLVAEEQEKKKNEDKSSNRKKDSKSRNSKVQNSTSKMVQNLVGRFVAISVGAVVLVNTNPVLAERFPFLKISSTEQEPPVQTLSENWKWSDDKGTVTLEFVDGDGTVVKELAAVVSISEESATCNTAGTKVYTATAGDDEKVYTDSRSEVLPATGHDFSLVETVELENGQKITFECANCHERSVITTTIEEND